VFFSYSPGKVSSIYGTQKYPTATFELKTIPGETIPSFTLTVSYAVTANISYFLQMSELPVRRCGTV